MKCPQCGQWCVAEHKGFFGGLRDRFLSGFNESAENAAEIGGSIGEKIGIKEAGETVGAFIDGASYIGLARGVLRAIAGDKYQFVCPECNAKWSTDDENDNQESFFEKEQHVISLKNKFLSCEKGEYKQLITQLQQALNDNEYNTEEVNAVLYDLIAATYYRLGNNTKALDSINHSLNIYDDPSSHVIRGMIELEGNHAPFVVLKDLVYHKRANANPYFSQNYIQQIYNEQEKQYIDTFLSIPKDKRRFLYLAQELACFPNSFLVLPYDNLPKEIEFRGCVPTMNTLYVMHPYKPSCYIPAKNMEVELFRDEMHEFIHIMECLGAQHIKFQDITANEQKNKEATDRAANANVGYEDYSVNGGYSSHNEAESQSSLYDEFGTEKEFDLSREIAPYIPNDVVWINGREEWKRSCVSRLEGRLRHDNYRVFTQTSELVSMAQKQTIEAEIKALNAQIGGGYESFDSFSSEVESTHIWECVVDFYPLSDYMGSAVKPISNDILTEPKRKKNWIVWALGVAVVALAIVLVLLLVL